MNEMEALIQAIAALESQRALLGDATVDTALEPMRAKLAMLGWEARVSEREQNGRTVYRVRVGPFSKRDDAEQLKEKLEGAGVESAMVRVQR